MHLKKYSFSLSLARLLPFIQEKKILHDKLLHTCKRVLMVSNGVVIQDAVAPAIIPPAA